MEKRFLLRMLACIFAFQGLLFGVGLFWCGRNEGLKSCPEIAKRYENTFNVALATTLALLTGTAITNKDV